MHSHSHRFFVLLSVLSIGIVGCSGSGAVGSNSALGDGTIVTTNPTATSPFSSFSGKTGIAAFIRRSEAGETVVQRPITISSAYTQNGEEIFALVAPPSDSYGLPDCGSPVLVNGNVVGAVYSVADPQHLYAVAIGQEETTGQGAGKKAPAVPLSSVSSPTGSGCQWYFAGPSSMMPFVTKLKGLSGTQLASSGSASSAILSAASTGMLAGQRFGAAILYGPEASQYVAATYSLELPSANWIGTGHAIEQNGGLNGNGPVQWPVFTAYTDFIGNTGVASTHLTGNPYGTLTFDGLYGSLINPAKAPTTMPIEVQMQLNGTNLATVTHQGVLDRGSAYEEDAVDLGTTTPVDLAIYSLPDAISATGSITFEADGQAFTTQLTFTNPEESPSAILSDVEINVDEAFLAQYINNPTMQITQTALSLQMITTPVARVR